ncbi:leucyl aminopeptidase [uncultured Boseongicola sp.]|uniref:leucyl aminopeptidase n=1 Tax=uncultured Boseongicola sp. TaxID=1648499 RepID=UPI00260539BE|nr:leucyl aminopeptidase [uncultured Boseongicola sp.]
MTDLPTFTLSETSLDQIAEIEGRIVIFMPESGKLDQSARRVNRLMRGALERFAESTAFSKMKQGEATDLAFPTGMRADAVQVIRLDLTADPEAERRAGAAIGAGAVKGEVLIFAGERKKLEHLMMGCLLKAYAFGDHKTDHGERGTVEITMMVAKPDDLQSDLLRVQAVAEGVYFTRDLVNEPANVLTTVTFADRLEALRELGLKVEVLDEDRLEELGMRTLLAVGFGSETPSKVVIMEWTGRGTEAPLALVGKGVVFDTGGISIKPAGGMEEMTMDMGGAGTVAGVMKALALRKAAANVVGIVGLVENMPDGRAQRPGDVVRSMKGDTVEVINTDAEGRLVLCDIMWYAQERFEPRAMIDLATLTGAVIVALGHENAGVFSNDDTLVGSFLAAAATEDEGAWRMPLGEGYARALKSRIADVKNTGGRPAGSITAAEFLQRFVKKDTPWIHLDIAGVASTDAATTLAPKGATGWGVRALDRLVSDRFEG